MDTLHEDQHTFSFISRSFLLRMRTVCDKICRENQHTHLTFRFFFFENHASYVIRWKNTVVPGRPQMIIWLMCISRWVPKATHTHTHTHTHTIRKCNINCLFTATMVARTRLNVTSYVLCLSSLRI